MGRRIQSHRQLPSRFGRDASLVHEGASVATGSGQGQCGDSSWGAFDIINVAENAIKSYDVVCIQLSRLGRVRHTFFKKTFFNMALLRQVFTLLVCSILSENQLTVGFKKAFEKNYTVKKSKLAIKMTELQNKEGQKFLIYYSSRVVH